MIFASRKFPKIQPNLKNAKFQCIFIENKELQLDFFKCCYVTDICEESETSGPSSISRLLYLYLFSYNLGKA